jgi:ankyrin repeat protein
VKLLLEKGADIESKDWDSRTSLSWAARNGYQAAVKLLLEKGTGLESKDHSRTPPGRYCGPHSMGMRQW